MGSFARRGPAGVAHACGWGDYHAPVNDDELLADLLAAHARTGRFEDGPALEAAFRIAAEAHRNQQRDDGRPYLTHPVRVARVLLEEWEQDGLELIQAALLHDVVEDSEVTLADIEERFGAEVAGLVDHLTKPPVAEGEEKSARDARYYERLSEGPEGAKLVKLADRLDNLRDMLRANWSEAKKRDYCQAGLETIAPIAAGAWPEETEAFRLAAEDILAAILCGEGDVPDVGPHQDMGDAGADPDDRSFILSPRLSFFVRANGETYLFHDLIGDIIQLHEKVVPFLDYFREPHRESEAREAFKDEFLPGDFDAFFETLGKHLVLLTDREEDTRTTRDWYPLQGPWIVSYVPPGQVVLCYRDRRSEEIVEETLSPLLGDLWKLCEGALTTGELVRRLARMHPDVEDVEGKVRAAIRRWTHSERQLLKLIPRPRSAYEVPGGGLPPYAQSTMPYPRSRSGEAPPPEVDLRQYHRIEIDDALEQFEAKETTLSHALRERHPALGERSYGEAFVHALIARDLIPIQGPPEGRKRFRALELGGGVGFFGAAFLDTLALRAPRLFNRLRYTIVDLSPELSRSQRERLERHASLARFVSGEAERLPIADGSLDLLVSNEVIADLRVVPTRRQDVEYPESEDAGGEGAQLLRRYGVSVSDAPGLFFANVGAIRFVEEIARVLQPGGVAVLTEYGEIDRYPAESSHLDHPEFSIHFGHLDAAARACGLVAEVESVPRFLELQGEVEVLQTTQTFFLTLRAFLATRGVTLEKQAYTPQGFAELLAGKLDPTHIQGLRFGPAGKRVLGLKPPEFKALILRRPKTERAAPRASITLDL